MSTHAKKTMRAGILDLKVCREAPTETSNRTHPQPRTCPLSDATHGVDVETLSSSIELYSPVHMLIVQLCVAWLASQDSAAFYTTIDSMTWPDSTCRSPVMQGMVEARANMLEHASPSQACGPQSPKSFRMHINKTVELGSFCGCPQCSPILPMGHSINQSEAKLTLSTTRGSTIFFTWSRAGYRACIQNILSYRRY